ncbi:MAG: DUF4359 domain-containing protein [Cyanobacteria bacterium M_surface_10_m2_179]|nr:DUF4359 domain-containing protein [Cyanobacteria bacterium M_surface_10_m2_179]
MDTSGGRWPWGWCVAALLAGGALLVSNPGEREFEAFAGEQLAAYATEELCSAGGLPLVAQLLIQNCTELIAAQRQTLGRIAAAETRRYNAGFFSLYSTQLGGQTVLPGLRIPRYRALTLAGAGQLVVVNTGREDR